MSTSSVQENTSAKKTTLMTVLHLHQSTPLNTARSTTETKQRWVAIYEFDAKNRLSWFSSKDDTICTLYDRCVLRGDERRLHDMITVMRTIGEETAKYYNLSYTYEQYHDSLAKGPLQHPAVETLSKCLPLSLTQPVMCLVINDRLEIFMNNTHWHLHLWHDTTHHIKHRNIRIILWFTVGCLMSHSTHYTSFREWLSQLVIEIRLKSHQNHTTMLQIIQL